MMGGALRPARIAPDLVLAEERIAETGSTLGRPLHRMAVTSSTNEDAKSAARQGAPHGATWLAEEQTHGRGRRGRTWISAPGEALLFSTLVRLACSPARLPLIPLLAGLAVRDAVARAAPGADPRVKWPNDVLVGGRKLAGVLVEAVTSSTRVDAVIVGIGINVHTREFPDAVAASATSVALISVGTIPPDRSQLLADTLASLDRDLEVVLARGLGLVRARLEAADFLRGKLVRSDEGVEGIASGIDEQGRLCVRTKGGALARWSSGEVTLAKV